MINREWSDNKNMKRIIAFVLTAMLCISFTVNAPHAEAVSNECFVPRNLADFYNRLLPEYAKMAFGSEYNKVIKEILESFTVAYSETVDNILYYESGSGDIEIAALFNSGIPGDSRAADGLYLLGAEQMRGLLMETLCDYLVYYDDSVDGKKLADWLDENNESGGNAEFYGYAVGVVWHDGYFHLSLEKGQAGSGTKKSAANDGCIYCPSCGQKIAADSKFCMYCGFKIPLVSAPASKTPQPTKTPAPVTKTWSSWSSWSTSPAYSSSTREVETRTTVKGYNMFHYRTQYRDAPYPRVFRDYSINGDYDWKYSRRSYGEKYMEKYVTADQLAAATIYSPDSRNVYNGKHPGYQDGSTIAYGFKDDEFMWFIRSKDTVTEYRYRDLK